jgi:FkbM family methyltransferase
LRNLIATIFRGVFKLDFLKGTYFGFYKKIFKPFNLFKGVRKKILYRNKIILILHIDDWIQQNIYFKNTYEEHEISFVEHSLKKGDVFIDVGANIGIFSLVASLQVGEEGKVYSFEPIKKNYDSLTNHIQINNIKNAILEKIAVSDNQGILNLYLNENDKNSGMATAYSDNFTLAETVPSTSLDLYFADKNDRPIKLIKIDIEGGEYPALLGMQQLLRKDKPDLLIEINPDTPHGQKKIEDFLFELDYKKYFIDHNGLLLNEKSIYDKSTNYIFSCNNVYNAGLE